MRSGWTRGPATGCLVAAAMAACGDSTEPVTIPLPEEATPAVLADFVTGDLLDPSAFDLVTGNAVRTDQVSGWDFIFLIDESDGPVLISRGSYVAEVDEQAGIQIVDVAFEDLLTAPEDGYVVAEPVPIQTGDVFVTRSRSNPNLGGVRCRYYGKFEVEAIGEMAATLEFVHLINPNCENRNLDPSTNP